MYVSVSNLHIESSDTLPNQATRKNSIMFYTYYHFYMKVATVVLADNFVTKPKTGVFTVISVQ